MKYISCPDLSENPFVSFFSKIGDSVYKFSFRWNEYCDCCLCSVSDSENNAICKGFFLTNGAKIFVDERKIPVLKFVHKNELTFEATRENMKDYRLVYEDSEE